MSRSILRTQLASARRRSAQGVIHMDEPSTIVDLPIPEPRIYIAGPFFNAEQIRLIDKIEIKCSEADLNFFSPRLQHGNKMVDVKNPEHAQEIFKRNHAEILECNALLAVLDYALPQGHELRVVNGLPITAVKYSNCHAAYSDALALPDTGTVWEMGVAYAKEIPVVGFCSGERPGYLNVMITQSMVGVINGWDNLEEWLPAHAEGEEYNFKAWDGDHE